MTPRRRKRIKFWRWARRRYWRVTHEWMVFNAKPIYMPLPKWITYDENSDWYDLRARR